MSNHRYTTKFINQIRVSNDEYHEDLDLILHDLKHEYTSGTDESISSAEGRLENWFAAYIAKFTGLYTELKGVWESGEA